MVGIRRIPSYKGAPKITLTVFWLDGTKTHINGTSLGDALNNCGFSNSSIHEIAFASNGIDDRWVWHGDFWVLKAGSNV